MRFFFDVVVFLLCLVLFGDIQAVIERLLKWGGFSNQLDAEVTRAPSLRPMADHSVVPLYGVAASALCMNSLPIFK